MGNKIEETYGTLIDKYNDEWFAECPKCNRVLYVVGFFDEGVEYKCKCGCAFRVCILHDVE